MRRLHQEGWLNPAGREGQHADGAGPGLSRLRQDGLRRAGVGGVESDHDGIEAALGCRRLEHLVMRIGQEGFRDPDGADLALVLEAAKFRKDFRLNSAILDGRDCVQVEQVDAVGSKRSYRLSTRRRNVPAEQTVPSRRAIQDDALLAIRTDPNDLAQARGAPWSKEPHPSGGFPILRRAIRRSRRLFPRHRRK